MDIYATATQYLAERAVNTATAYNAHLNITDNAKTLDRSFYARAALVIPYLTPDGQHTGFQRVRYFDPPQVGGVRKKAIRYQQPKGTAPEIYLPPVAGADWQAILGDATMPLIITEGEIKALSVMVNAQMATVGLGGVFMFADNKAMLPLFEKTNWNRRHVYIVFDSDIDTKVGVQLAEARLAQWLIRRRAIVHTTRLPPSLTGEKQGADDFIAANGPDAFTGALRSARALTDMDLRVLELNDEVAYLDGEEKLIELKTGNLIRKDSFTSGTRYSTMKVPMQVGDKVKHVSVASTWLTHPMATRYVNTIFQPGGAETIQKDDGMYLNSWQEQPCHRGDVSLFETLTKYLFEDTLDEDWDWPIKLLAYKVQNQRVKIPLSIMLIGEQGSGKSVWAALAKSAFGEYGQSRNGKDLMQDWNGFLEKSLFVVIDDVSVRQIRSNIETLRNWISEARIERHEKYLKNREIDNYALIFFTTNHRDAGAFAHDDRRFLVVGAPRREHGEDFYEPIWRWLRSGQAGPALYYYLLHYDLKGWTPPIVAPSTAEKRMAYEESLSDFERLARDMKLSDVHVIDQWLSVAEQWAVGVIGAPGHADTSKAYEILTAIQAFPIRPWYTSDELCQMFPHMLRELEHSTRRYSSATLPGRVSTALRNHGIYFLVNTDNPEGFVWRGRRQNFLIICPNAGYPRKMSQAEFDQAMASFGNYVPKTFSNG